MMWNALWASFWTSKKYLRLAESGFGLAAVSFGVAAYLIVPWLGLIAAVAALIVFFVNRRVSALGAPRRLIGPQKDQVVACLLSRQICDVHVCCPLGDSEAEQYANDI